MISPTLFITIALYLAGLSYFLGALIYALPLPFPSLKQWGPTMMKDAIYVTVWVMIYNIVLSVADSILNLLGVNWTNFLTGLQNQTIELGVINFVLNFLGGGGLKSVSNFLSGGTTTTFITTISVSPSSSQVFSVTPFSKLQLVGEFIKDTGIVNIFASIVQDLFLFYLSVYILSVLIYNGTPLFITFGIFLMSLPFRIGRSIGATFIGTSLAFYIGLPLMSAFDSLIASAIYGAYTPPLAIIGQYIVEYLVARIAYIVLLAAIAGGLSRAIGETAEELPFKIQRYI